MTALQRAPGFTVCMLEKRRSLKWPYRIRVRFCNIADDLTSWSILDVFLAKSARRIAISVSCDETRRVEGRETSEGAS